MKLQSNRLLGITLLVELGLGAVGVVAALFMGIPIVSAFHWDAGSLFLGVGAALVPALLLPASHRANSGPFFELKQLVQVEIWPMLRSQSWFALVLMAFSAGIGEELFFRGFLQPWFATWVGIPIAIIAASLLFGLLHPLHWLYVVIAGAIGVYLGGLYVLTGNLIVPIVAHAVYDVLALGYFKLNDPGPPLRTRSPSQPSETDSAIGIINSSEHSSIPREETAMKAAYVNEPGPAASIQVGDLPKPTPKGKEVLVRVHATAVNPIDTYVRAGLVKMPIPLPYIIGSDVAGTVEAVGPEATRFRAGDRVWGSNQGLLGRQGVTAEYAAIDEGFLYPTPAGVDDATAAAVALVGITAHLGLFRDAQLRAGEIVFVNGGAGGVGSTVVQMAKAVGAHVITTVGNAENETTAKKLGADHVLNYKSADLAKELPALAPNGINVWWETLREPNLELTIPLLAKRGRLVLMAGRDAKPLFPVGAFYTKDCKVLGFAMFNATQEEQRACADDINRWLSERKFRANIGKEFPLAEAAAAHQLQEENTLQKKGTLSGKIVIKI